MTPEGHDAAMLELKKYAGRLERDVNKPYTGAAVTINRIYQIRHGRLHARLDVDLGGGTHNEYHIAYTGARWRKV